MESHPGHQRRDVEGGDEASFRWRQGKLGGSQGLATQPSAPVTPLPLPAHKGEGWPQLWKWLSGQRWKCGLQNHQVHIQVLGPVGDPPTIQWRSQAACWPLSLPSSAMQGLKP